MSQPDPKSSLQRAVAVQTYLGEQLAPLTPADMERLSNLPGWRIADLAVHVTRVCDSILLAVKRATTRDRTPAFGPSMKPREDEIRAMAPGEWGALQQRDCAAIHQVVDGLSDTQVNQLSFPHPQGDRSIAWFCTQLLAELAFHTWDLAQSLGRNPTFDDDLARYLLPFLLNPSQSLFSGRRTTGAAQAFGLSTGEATWTLQVTDTGTTVATGRPAQGAVVTGPAGAIALALYGRVRLDTPVFHVDGPSDTPARFAAIFGPAD